MIPMQTRLIAAAILPLILLTAGCDRGPSTLVGSVSTSEGTGFTIRSTQVVESSTLLRGTFEAHGSIQDEGTVQDVLYSPAPPHLRSSVSGVKTLSSEKGTIEIKYYVGLTPSGPNMNRAMGGFTILGGTGLYEGIYGGGRISMHVASDASPGEIAKVLTGDAYFERYEALATVN